MPSERRAFVRAHHPDVGGDPTEFRIGLARFDAAGRSRPDGGEPVVLAEPPAGRARVTVYRRRRGVRRWAAAAAVAVRRRRATPRVR